MNPVNPTKQKTVNTVEAKNRFNELIAQVNRTKNPLIVEKRGQPVAVVLDYESYQKQKGQKAGKADERDTFIEELEAWHRYLRKKYPKGTGDSVELIREAREERMKIFE